MKISFVLCYWLPESKNFGNISFNCGNPLDTDVVEKSRHLSTKPDIFTTSGRCLAEYVEFTTS